MNISVVCVGKLKEKYLKAAIEEYAKRLSRYCKLEIIEVSDEKTPDNASDKEEALIKEKEGLGILKHIRDNSFVITLDLKGKMLSSEELADFIKESAINGNSNLTFIIGGSLGLSNSVLARANFSLCFSKMTFPHQLMRVILLEQIYRGYRIINNEPYHK
ncbi:23S rRNA (pseudouridine(1915)-N(3))-methyltransferase RlmH [Clostridiaceae bacterium UIB06]|uniref:Ribosomal RNA large subunit methyltransferase H n=1 Tax=Clostridium thailandense TaxID=2794346 RepID=A0A949TTT4_9CLOT|nr:23S rRNA (pseudouridine(1915)-N(3))-methyltransferase RlmH [Clostridium thailandense]MBV7273281.1 23S rRNA (pseudouridine(1915)-N(3))-methyltransferase RlmH [Clostridium thailandense]MCH5137306.1 23S rRNA (pseudouridine(1915)-N(3))-methyltransferase RlmH [Clostridiaceae bacterium UIB06]